MSIRKSTYSKESTLRWTASTIPGLYIKQAPLPKQDFARAKSLPVNTHSNSSSRTFSTLTIPATPLTGSDASHVCKWPYVLSEPPGDNPVEVINRSQKKVHVGNLIAKFYENPDPDCDILSQYEMNDNEELLSYLTSKDHILELVDCFAHPISSEGCSTEEIDKLQYVSSIAYYIFTSISNTAVVDALVKDFDALDYFFRPLTDMSMRNQQPAPEWFGAIHHLLCKYESEILIQYMRSADSNTNVLRGTQIVRNLLECLHNKRIFDTLTSMFNRTESVITWCEHFAEPDMNLSSEIAMYIRNACEQALSSYAKQVGLLAITDLIQCILKTSQETPVSKSFCNREFIAPVLSVAISNIHGNPNAANVLDILMALLDTSVYSEAGSAIISLITEPHTLEVITNLVRSACKPVTRITWFTWKMIMLIQRLAANSQLFEACGKAIVQTDLMKQLVEMAFQHSTSSIVLTAIKDIICASVSTFARIDPETLVEKFLVPCLLVDRLVSTIKEHYTGQNNNSPQRNLIAYLIEILLALQRASVTSDVISRFMQNHAYEPLNLCEQLQAERKQWSWEMPPGTPSIEELKSMRRVTNVASLGVD